MPGQFVAPTDIVSDSIPVVQCGPDILAGCTTLVSNGP